MTASFLPAFSAVSQSRSAATLGASQWLAAARQRRQSFRGTPGTLALFGDSMTVTRAFWSPWNRFFGPRLLDTTTERALKRVRRYMRQACWSRWKGPRFGNEGLKTIRWAAENVSDWLASLKPETVLLSFGSNDLVNMSEEDYQQLTREVASKCLDFGSVVLLMTAPPRSDRFEKSCVFADIVRRIGDDLSTPVIDYHREILSRRPDDWDGSLPQFATTPGDIYQTPTLIARDGLHPSLPRRYPGYDAEGLRNNGYVLRNWLALHAYAEVIDMLLDPAARERLHSATTFYASFDEAVASDYGKGQKTPDTRFNHPVNEGEFVFEKGFDQNVFRIAPGKGISGGALEVVDVLPRNGRIFFPAKDNLPFASTGWSGALSMWCDTDPNTLLKTTFCDPVQITEKGANDGGLWFDFNNEKPRDMRHGAFPAGTEEHPAFKETDADAPMVPVRKIDWKAGDWHHVVLSWQNFDTGRNDGESVLYIDGRRIGAIGPRSLAMRWNIDKTGIYVSVNYIGLLDEMIIFNRALTNDEVQLLRANPGMMGSLRNP